MKPSPISLLFVLLTLYSCNRSANNAGRKSFVKTNAVHKQASGEHAVKLIPIPGYRFVISGDFDGDGRSETLTEHFVSGIDHRETNKFYENGDYDTLVALNRRKKPVSFLTCSNRRISDVMIDDRGSSLGLAYLKNEGDLDGDGGDEISYVVDWADWSNVNFCEIITCKNHHWQTLYTFQIRDWQLPDLPQTYNQYGFAGLQNKIINPEHTAANTTIEKNLHDFKGLIKKKANYKIQIIHTTDEADIDTTIVDIRRHPHKKRW